MHTSEAGDTHVTNEIQEQRDLGHAPQNTRHINRYFSWTFASSCLGKSGGKGLRNEPLDTHS